MKSKYAPKKSYIRVLSFSLLISILNHSYAKNTTITLSGGFGKANLRHNKTLLMLTDPQPFSNRYVASSDHQIFFSPQLFLGRTIWQDIQKSLQLGILLGYINNLAVNGVVEQFALSEFDNLNYHYNIRNTRILFSSNAIRHLYNQWSIYFNPSIGMSNNKSWQYKETPRIIGAEPMSPFSENSKNTFTYNLGIGLIHRLKDNFSINLGYQFMSLGKSTLGISSSQTTSNTLSQNIYLNECLVGVTANF